MDIHVGLASTKKISWSIEDLVEQNCYLGFLKMPPRRLDLRQIDELYNDVEGKISEKIRVDIRSEMALMKSDMIAEIVSALGGMPRHVGTKDSYEEVVEDFEAARSSGRSNQVKRPRGGRTDQLLRPRSQLKLKHKMEVSNF